MFEEQLNSVDAEHEDVVDSQDETEEEIKEEPKEKGAKEPEPAEPVQAPDENAKFAAARRESEAKLKEVEAKANLDKTIAKKYGKDYEVFSAEDIKEKYNMTMDEFENAILQQKYKEAGLDPTLINEAISSHPLIKQAGQYISEFQETKRQEAIKSDIEGLHRDFPEMANIKTEEDLYELPNWDDIHSYIKRGYELSDAYYKVNKSQLTEKAKSGIVKSTVANIHDRARRGVVTPDGSNADDSEASEVDSEMARAFGNDPKKIASYVKKQTKRS